MQQEIETTLEEPQSDQDKSGREVEAVVMSILPWGVSVMLHGGLILLAIFIVWTTVQQNVEDEEVIIPVTRLGVRPGGALTMNTSLSSKGASIEGSFSRSLTETAVRSAPGGPIGGGPGVGPGGGGKTSGQRLIGIGGGGGGAGKSNPFAGAGGGGDGPFSSPSMYGVGDGGGNVRKIVYLIDASGSLIDTLPFVINELKKSINELSDQQQFSVVFFQDDKVIEVPPAGLKKADLDTKQRVSKWLDPQAGNVIPGGMTSPINAIKLALKYKPQLLFILSDNITGRGPYERDQREILAEIQKANTSGTKINTLQFLYPDPLTQYKDDSGNPMPGTLAIISERTGGIYRFVDGSELGL